MAKILGIGNGKFDPASRANCKDEDNSYGTSCPALSAAGRAFLNQYRYTDKVRSGSLQIDLPVLYRYGFSSNTDVYTAIPKRKRTDGELFRALLASSGLGRSSYGLELVKRFRSKTGLLKSFPLPSWSAKNKALTLIKERLRKEEAAVMLNQNIEMNNVANRIFKESSFRYTPQYFSEMLAFGGSKM